MIESMNNADVLHGAFLHQQSMLVAALRVTGRRVLNVRRTQGTKFHGDFGTSVLVHLALLPAS
jgi:hypothetical protein